jgi:L-amino acid N-acyltransferase YncA
MKQDHFGGKMKIEIVDLKLNLSYVKEYIELRNLYTDKLCTSKVDIAETIMWIKTTKNIIKILLNDKELVGVAILYVEKNNEITIFTKYHKKGYGNKLLYNIEKTAVENNIDFVYAWIDQTNRRSLNLFRKNNYLQTASKIKYYNGQKYIGYNFKKELKNETYPE